MGKNRHQRFLAAAAAGLATAFIVPLDALPARILAGIDAFSLLYLGLMLHYAATVSPAILRRHAAETDEGVPLITVLAVGIVSTSLTAIFLSLSGPQRAGPATLTLALASVPLGWAMLHTVFSFHYARMFYTPKADGEGDAGGMLFENTPEPGPWEFLYNGFTVGMTAQVSDVPIGRTGMRQLVLAHAILSFFYNTVILALAVNLALSIGV